MANDTYQPVPHDVAFREQLLANPEVQAAFDASAIEYAILDEMLSARRDAGLTQAQIAELMGTKAPAITRLENSLASGKHSPSIETLRKYAKALGKRLEIHLV
jgi:DNA-binding XRE family transcriptional regulator